MSKFHKSPTKMAPRASADLPSAPEALEQPTRGRVAQRLQRAKEILESARDVFLEKGFEKASVAEIASRVGVVEGLVYRYFPSKRELLNAVMLAMYEPLITDVRAGFDRIRGLQGRLRFIVWRHLRVYAETPGLARLMLHEVRTGPEYEHTQLHGLHVRYTSPLQETIQQAVADGELGPDVDYGLTRSLVYGGLEHLMWPTLQGRSQVVVEQLATAFTEQILRSLGHARVDASDLESRLARLERLAVKQAANSPFGEGQP